MTRRLQAFILLLAIAVAVGTLYSPVQSSAAAPATYTYGNTWGNVQNDAIVAQSGDWIYFNPRNASSGENAYLYKMKKDGTSVTKTPIKAQYQLNIVNGWAYFSGSKGYYYRQKLDGTMKENLGFKGEDIQIVNGWIYYLDAAKHSQLWKSSLDGKTKKIVTKDPVNDVQVLGDWIFYVNGKDGNKLYKIKTDGTGRTKLNNAFTVSYMLVNKDWLVYEANQRIYKLRTNGKDLSVLTEDQPGPMNTDGKFVYYANNDDDRKLYRISLDGKTKQKLTDGMTTFIHVIGDWLYFTEQVDYETVVMFRMKTDGTGKRPVQPMRPDLAMLFSTENKPLLFVNGKLLTGKNEQPIYYKGVLYLPLKAIFDRINGTYIWNEKEKSATVAREYDFDFSTTFTVGKAELRQANGSEYLGTEDRLDDGSIATPILLNGVMYVPANSLYGCIKMNIQGEKPKHTIRIGNGY